VKNKYQLAKGEGKTLLIDTLRSLIAQVRSFKEDNEISVRYHER